MANRRRLTRMLHKTRFLRHLYKFEFVKRVYRRLIAGIPQEQYYLELSSICNAECIFCTYPILRDHGKELMKMAGGHFDRALDLMKKNPRSSVSLTPTTGDILVDGRWAESLQCVLDLDFVDDVHFYTNGILLHNKNLDKLLSLNHLEKLSIAVSTGGVNRESYALMFGTDRFEAVRANVNAMMRRLESESMGLQVSIDVKMPEGAKTSVSECEQVYNEPGYRYAFMKIRSTFDTFSGLIRDDRLGQMSSARLERRTMPCNYLRDIRFAANGEIWLCGCVISETPGHEELKVGHLDGAANLESVTARQVEISERWRQDGEIPHVCRECTWYSPQGGS